MLNELPQELKNAVDAAIQAEKAKGDQRLKDRVAELEAALAKAKYETDKSKRKHNKDLKEAEENIRGLISWALEAQADPVNAVGKVSPGLLDTILEKSIELPPAKIKPMKPLSSMLDRSIIERGRCLESELPDLPKAKKGDEIEKTDMGGGNLPGQDQGTGS